LSILFLSWTLRPCHGQAPARHGFCHSAALFPGTCLPRSGIRSTNYLSSVLIPFASSTHTVLPKIAAILSHGTKPSPHLFLGSVEKPQREASSVLYAQNRFDLERLLGAQFFLIIIGPANCRFLTRLGRFTITYGRSGRLPWSPGTRPEFALQPFVHKWRCFEDSIGRGRLLQRSFENSRSYHQYEVGDYEGKI
jgi:hypothetical protein